MTAGSGGSYTFSALPDTYNLLAWASSASNAYYDRWYSSGAYLRFDLATPVVVALDVDTEGLDVILDPVFVDVSNYALFDADINWMADSGITFGCGSAAFCPGEPVTRAQMASFLVRALLLSPSETNYFTDVTGTHRTSINALRESGITLGCDASGTLFCPDDEVTRAQMASFLVRALNLPATNVDYFTDVSGPHRANINALRESEITLGCNTAGTAYCPNDSVIRAHMAAFLRRGLEDDYPIYP